MRKQRRELDSAGATIASKIMDLFARGDDWRGIGKIMRAASVGVDRAAIREALQELVSMRFLQFNPLSRKYRLASYRSPRQIAAETPKPKLFEDGFVWPSGPGATLSENNAIKEYGVTHDELASAANQGELHWLRAYAHGNPYNKLVRKEVEALVRGKRGDKYIKDSKLKTELREVTTEIRSSKRELAIAERRKAKLAALLERGRR